MLPQYGVPVCPLSGFAGLQDFTEPFSAYGGCAHPRREALALHSAAEHSEKREQRVTSQIIAVRTGRTIFDEMTAHQ